MIHRNHENAPMITQPSVAVTLRGERSPLMIRLETNERVVIGSIEG
jgi:hypothetical protein